MQTYKQRLTFRAVCANNVRVLFNCFEIEQRAMLHERMIKCTVYERRNGFAGIKSDFTIHPEYNFRVFN